MENATTLRPSRTAVGVALLVIVVSAGLVWLGAMMIVMPGDPPPAAGILCSAPSVIIGVSQFWGTFRRRPHALLWAHFGLLLVGSILLALPSLMLFLMLTYGAFSALEQFAGLCCGLILVSSVVLWCAWVNYECRRQLLAAPQPRLPLWQFSFQELLCAITLLGVLLVFTRYWLRT